jgi:ribulose-phosphate 3-epimerase
MSVRRPQIAPSILAADFARLGEEIRAVEAAGADCIHVDVMDGHFVPNITLGPFIVEAVKRATSLPLDVHLMIEEPERYIEDFVRAGANTVGVQVETCPHLHRTVGQIHDAGARACVVLNPATPASAVDVVLPDVDQVLVMTVNPGFGGQKFLTSQLDKIRTLRQRIDQHVAGGGTTIDLEVDGGVDANTAPQAASAGADVLVAGTAAFRGGPGAYADNISALRSAAVAGP